MNQTHVWVWVIPLSLFLARLAVATVREESRSARFTALAVAWPLALAWLASFAFYQGARAFGLH